MAVRRGQQGRMAGVPAVRALRRVGDERVTAELPFLRAQPQTSRKDANVLGIPWAFGNVQLPLLSSSSKATAIFLLALSAAGLTGLVAVMPARQTPPERREPVPVEGASPAT